MAEVDILGMPKFEMPMGDTGAPTEYAGKEPEYEIRSIMLTSEGKRVIVFDYLKDIGLYVVGNIDDVGTRSPAYRISPDKLKKIEENKE